MYYFYIIKPTSRVGFGIAADPISRLQKYISHTGEIVEFARLYGGLRSKSHALERSIKQIKRDELWTLTTNNGVWRTEWLNSNINLQEFIDFVETLNAERHYGLSLIAKNYSII